MTWIRHRGVPTGAHPCKPPTAAVALFSARFPDGDRGDVWRCDTCGRLWIIAAVRGNLRWTAAGLWQRWRFRHEGQTQTPKPEPGLNAAGLAAIPAPSTTVPPPPPPSGSIRTR